MNNFISDLISLGLVSFLLIFIFSLCMFFIIREITLWYFRINENTDSLRRIADSLEEISATLAADEIVTEEETITEDNVPDKC